MSLDLPGLLKIDLSLLSNYDNTLVASAMSATMPSPLLAPLGLLGKEHFPLSQADTARLSQIDVHGKKISILALAPVVLNVQIYIPVVMFALWCI